METIELTEHELSIIRAALEFCQNGNIGLECIYDYDGIDNDLVWEDTYNLLKKL